MNKNDIVLNNSTATWVLPPTQGELGGTYTGRFVFRCFLDPLQDLKAGREFRELLGSLAIQATEKETNLAFALTQLKHRIISSPPFWSSTAPDSGIEGNIGDINIIALVLEAAMVSEELFKEKVKLERDFSLERSIKLAEELQKKNSGE